MYLALAETPGVPETVEPECFLPPKTDQSRLSELQDLEKWLLLGGRRAGGKD